MITMPKAEQNYANRGLALVADDDPTMREIMTVFLTEAGFKVLQAASGREAVSIAINLDFSIAFIDLAMPNGNGLQTCAALRSAPRWRDIPIVVLTAYPIEMALRAALDAGASGFLCKPLDPSELQWCLETHIKIAARSASVALDSPSVTDRNTQFATDIFDMSEEILPPFDSHWILNHNSAHSSGSRIIEPVSKMTIRSAETEIDDLDRVAGFFPPNIMAGFLDRISVSVGEILLLIEGSGTALERATLDLPLHNLAGTAGTLGLKALSTAARNLQNDRSGSHQAKHHFVDTANRALDSIRAYKG